MGLIEALKVLTPVLLFLIMALLTVIGYFGRKMITDFKADLITLQKELKDGIKGNADKTAELEKDFLKFQAKLPHYYVTKNDHIRHMTTIEHKIDGIRTDFQSALSEFKDDVKTLIERLPKRSSDAET